MRDYQNEVRQNCAKEIPVFQAMAAVNFIPAVYVDQGARPYVQYSVRHPETQKMVRYRHYYSRIKDRRMRRQQAIAFVNEVNEKLLKGWAPWYDSVAPMMGAPLADMLDLYLKMKAQHLADRTLPTYAARINKLLDFMASRKLPKASCHQLTPRLASEFLDSLIREGLTARTCNNYLMDMKGIGNWAVQRGYWAKHPFDGMKPMKAAKPETRALTPEELRIMLERIEQKQPELLIVCGLIFYCALRPQEISLLRVSQIDINEGMLRVKADETKDKTGGWVTIPTQFLEQLKQHIKGAFPSDYVVSEKLRPGKKKRGPQRFAEAWARHRDAVGLSQEVQLYGLKHTAMRAFVRNQVDPVTIRDHVRHSNLSVTDAYMKSLSGYVDETVRDKYPDMR